MQSNASSTYFTCFVVREEPFEQPGLFVNGNTNSCICNGQNSLVILQKTGHCDGFPGLREFERVGQQVVYDGVQFIGIQPYSGSFGLVYQPEIDSFFFGSDIEIGSDGGNERTERNFLYLELHFLILNLSEIKQLVDESEHSVDVALYDDEQGSGVAGHVFVVQQMLHRA